MRSSSLPSATAERKLAGVRTAPAVFALILTLAGNPAGLAGQNDVSRQSLRDAQLRVLPVALAALVDLDVTAQPFIRPVDGRVSSGFGWRNIAVNGNRHHAGVDLVATWGTAVLAVRDGKVERSGWWGTYGNAVAIDHGDGCETRYAHLSSVAVSAGDLVRQGDVIGYVGSTGASTGPHLHFELRFDGRAVDPLGYLASDHATATR